MALSIEALRAAFKKNDNSSNTNSRPNNYYPFWNIADGNQATVRFLPDANGNNSMGFLVEKVMHTLTINGENKSVPCLRMYEEDCPICKVSAAFYKDDDRVNGKKYWKKKQYIAQGLILEDSLPPDSESNETHEGKVRFLALGYQLFNIIKDTFESGELDEVPFAYEGGTNFIIKKTKQGDYPNYSLSKFARKPTDLTEDQIALVQDQIVDLSTLLPQHPGVEKIEAMLEAALTGAAYETDSDSGLSLPKGTKSKAKATPARQDDDEYAAPWDNEGASAKPDAKATQTTKVEDSSDDEFEEEADQILAQIRARRNNKK